MMYGASEQLKEGSDNIRVNLKQDLKSLNKPAIAH